MTSFEKDSSSPGATPDARPGGPDGAVTGDQRAATKASFFRAATGCVLAWAVPGLGHVLLGRVRRGVLFAAVILALFVGGLALEGKVYKPEAGEPLTYLAAVGAAGVGVPFLVAHFAGVAEGNIQGRNFDYGNTFTLVAGLLNLLVVLDAFDVAAGRR